MLPFLFFKSKGKTPAELVKCLTNAIQRLDSTDVKTVEKAAVDCSRYLSSLKAACQQDSIPSADANAEVLAQVAQEAYCCSLLESFCVNLGKFTFEARKDAMYIFNVLVRRQIGSRTPTVEYINAHPNILIQLLRGYERQELALNYGLMLRECLRHEALARCILNCNEFYLLFDYVQLPTFDIASDAFATLKDLLTKHKMLVASFLIEKYDEIIPRYNLLLQSDNYVTRRQSLKLLGEILLDKANFDVMTKYIVEAKHLKLLMNLLRDKSKNIQFEAFHVFKIFVANPNKNKPIYDILLKNQRKLIEYLDIFQPSKDEDQFSEEKQFLMQQILDLAPAQRRDPRGEMS